MLCCKVGECRVSDYLLYVELPPRRDRREKRKIRGREGGNQAKGGVRWKEGAGAEEECPPQPSNASYIHNGAVTTIGNDKNISTFRQPAMCEARSSVHVHEACGGAREGSTDAEGTGAGTPAHRYVGSVDELWLQVTVVRLRRHTLRHGVRRLTKRSRACDGPQAALM